MVVLDEVFAVGIHMQGLEQVPFNPVSVALALLWFLVLFAGQILTLSIIDVRNEYNFAESVGDRNCQQHLRQQ